jgi:hypothetical protein
MPYTIMDQGMKKNNVVLLADSRYVPHENPDWYIQNIIADTLVKVANQQ